MSLTWPRSLAARLLLSLLGAQAFFIIIAMVAFPLLAPYTTYAAIADGTVRSLLTASLRHQPDGRLVLAESPALRRYAASRPSLSWAIADLHTGQVVSGSAADLVRMLHQLGELVPTGYGNLETKRPGFAGETVIVTTAPTPLGDVVFVTAGNVFGWADLPAFVSSFLPALIPMFAPLFLGAIIVVPLVVRHLLRSLNAAARAATAIDMRSLGCRLPTDGLASDFRPLIDAINAALDRLDTGFARQRLFTANAAHELRTPVAVLQARIDALPGNAPSRNDLRRDTRRLALLVDQLLAVARIGHQEAILGETVDLVSQVRALVADCAPLAIRAGRQIAFTAGAASVLVRGNARAIDSAVANLIDNALRAEPFGGTVNVTVTAQAEIVILDHGPGIDSADRPFVFEPFWRKNELTPGTGLGLAIVREVAALHGGTLVLSETEGGGATFRLILTSARLVGQTGAMQG